MKKKGMIPERHRIISENKWDDVIDAIDNGEYWEEGNFASADVGGFCGYCDYASSLEGGYTISMCKHCTLPKFVCRDHREKPDSYNWNFHKAMDNGDTEKARKLAIKIRDYIKNDKPKEPPCTE